MPESITVEISGTVSLVLSEQKPEADSLSNGLSIRPKRDDTSATWAIAGSVTARPQP